MGVISGCDLLFLNQGRKFIERRPLGIDLQVGVALCRLHVAMPEDFTNCIKINA